MVLLGFFLDLPRLTTYAAKDLEKFLLKIARGYKGSATVLHRSPDRIGLIFINAKDEVEVAYAAGFGNFGYKKFKKVAKDLPTAATNFGSEISPELLRTIFEYKPLYTMGDAYIERQIIFITSSLPNLASVDYRNILKAAKECCVSFEFALVNHRAITKDETDMFQLSFSDIANCSFRLWPADMISEDNHVVSLVNKLNDDSGDLKYILFPLERNTRDFNNVVMAFTEGLLLSTDIDVLYVYRICSVAVTARREAFTAAAENGMTEILWYAASTMSEVHNVIVNGLHQSEENMDNFGTVEALLASAAVLGKRLFIACTSQSSETDADGHQENHVSPFYLVICNVHHLG